MFKHGASNLSLRRRSLLVLVASFAAFATLFWTLADSVHESEFVVRIDQNVLEFVARHRVGWLTQAARGVTVLGSGWIVAVVIVGSATALILRHHFGDGVFVAASSAGSAIAVAIVKHAVGRSRPALSDRLVTATGAAFPSGHAAQSIACYGALAVVIVTASRSSRTRAFAIAGAVVIALAVGASRVYLGVHWMSDVVGGWLVATGWLLTLIGVRAALEAAPTSPPKA